MLNANNESDFPALHSLSLPSKANVPHNTGPIREEEVRQAVRTMRLHSAVGPDDIPNAVIKMPDMSKEVTDHLNKYWQGSLLPADWKKSVIVSIPKKSNSHSLDNQRGISKSSTVVKTLNKILLNRLLPCVNPSLLPLQAGFRPGRCSSEQIMSLRWIIDICRTTKRTSSIVFVDFRKAFDSVRGEVLRPLLERYDVPDELIDPIIRLHSSTVATVQTRHGPTEEFETTSGVLQGDTLAPLLLIIYVDYVLRNCLKEEDAFEVRPRQSSRHPAITLPALAYADDIAIICPDDKSATNVMNRLENAALSVGRSSHKL